MGPEAKWNNLNQKEKNSERAGEREEKREGLSKKNKENKNVATLAAAQAQGRL